MTCDSSKSLKDMNHYFLSASGKDVQVVIRPKYIGWNRRGKIAPKFLMVSAVVVLFSDGQGGTIDIWPTD